MQQLCWKFVKLWLILCSFVLFVFLFVHLSNFSPNLTESRYALLNYYLILVSLRVTARLKRPLQVVCAAFVLVLVVVVVVVSVIVIIVIIIVLYFKQLFSIYKRKLSFNSLWRGADWGMFLYFSLLYFTYLWGRGVTCGMGVAHAMICLKLVDVLCMLWISLKLETY